MSEVMERIVDGGIMVDPWSNICIREPERLHRYRWVAECSVVMPSCDRKKVA
jgi:hypothetical protein